MTRAVFAEICDGAVFELLVEEERGTVVNYAVEEVDGWYHVQEGGGTHHQPVYMGLPSMRDRRRRSSNPQEFWWDGKSDVYVPRPFVADVIRPLRSLGYWLASLLGFLAGRPVKTVIGPLSLTAEAKPVSGAGGFRDRLLWKVWDLGYAPRRDCPWRRLAWCRPGRFSLWWSGLRRVDALPGGMDPADPLSGTSEGDTVWCDICKERFSDGDYGFSCYLPKIPDYDLEKAALSWVVSSALDDVVATWGTGDSNDRSRALLEALDERISERVEEHVEDFVRSLAARSREGGDDDPELYARPLRSIRRAFRDAEECDSCARRSRRRHKILAHFGLIAKP